MNESTPLTCTLWVTQLSPQSSTRMPVLFVTIYPVPSWPFNLTPYIFILALIIGFGYMVWRESRHPGVLRRGATVFVGHRTDEEGDVDWDAPSPPSPQAQV